MNNIKQEVKNKYFLIPILISLSIVALALGGVGGSFQPSRMIILLMLPWLLVKLLKKFNLPIQKFSCQIILFCTVTFFLGILSIAWSIDRPTSFGALVVMLINMTPLVAIGLMSNDNLSALKRYLPIAWAVSAFLTLPLAFFELYTGNHFFLEHHERGGGISYLVPFAAGLNGNLNNYSLYLIFCFFGLSFFSFKNEVSKKKKYLIALLGVVIAVVIIINSGRATILTLFGLLFFRFEFYSNWKAIILAIISSLMVVKLFEFEGFFNLSILSEFLFLKFTDFSNDLEDQQGRGAILLAGMNGIMSSFGLGVGVGASTIYLDAIERVYIPNTHNLLLEWTLSFGILGLISFICFFITTILAVKNNIESSHRILIYSFVILTPLYGLAQSHLIGFTYFWLALATMATYSRPGVVK